LSASCYILEGGVLYRGFSRSFPVERWSRRERRWVKYRGKTPKGIEWGDLIDEAEARQIMDEAPAPAVSDDAPSFWVVLAKYPFVIRGSAAGAHFFNRRTGRWHEWPGSIPPCVHLVSQADAWKWLRSEALGLDFGTVERPWREWPEPATC